MLLEIIRNDLTKMKVDAIVKAANPNLKMGGGVCGAIFRAVGQKKLQVECDKTGGCAVVQAVITAGIVLPARSIIHTPGPIWQNGWEFFFLGANIASILTAEQFAVNCHTDRKGTKL